MDLTKFLANLRTDLKDSGAIWSDAELTRAIESAVDDMSRHIPYEKVYETVLDFTVTDESITTPTTSSATSIVNAKDISASVDGNTCTLALGFLDSARTVLMTLTDANNSITQMTIIVKGTDGKGYYQEEYFYRYNGKVQTGKKYFLQITEVEIHSITGNGASDVLSIGTGSHLNVWMDLDNPVSGSVVVTTTDGATTYTEDTDYEVDYTNGRIRLITGSSMAAGTEYYISYSKTKLGVDISSIIPEISRISRVEYPVGSVPQTFVNWGIWGNLLMVGSQDAGKSQSQLSDGEHMAIYYETRHQPPSLKSAGSYPEYLDQVVSIGAAAYALMIEASQYEQQAATDLTALRTELDNTTAKHALIVTALAKVSTYVGYAYGHTGSAATEAGVANTTLDTVTIDAATTALAAAKSVSDAILTTSIDKATTGAEAYLDSGDDTITSLGTAANRAENYANYARARYEIANARVQVVAGYVQEAQQRIASMEATVNQANGYSTEAQILVAAASQEVAMAQAFVAEGQVEAQQVQLYMTEAEHYFNSVQDDLALADRFKAEAQTRMSKFEQLLVSRTEYRKRTASIPVKQPM